MLKSLAQRVTVSLLFTATAAMAQAPLAFEVASIKKAEALSVDTVTSGKMAVGMTVDNAMVHITSMSIRDLIRFAYKVKTFQVSGPDWLKDDRFDVTAKIPAGANRDQVPEMLQTLLAERFKLTLHRSTTEVAVYALEVAKGGPKLPEATPDPADPAPVGGAAAPSAPTPADGGAQVRAAAVSDAKGGINSSSINGNVSMMPGPTGMHMQLTKMNTSGMVELIGRFVERPVVDQTDLKGKYDLTLDVGMEDMLALARGAGMSVPNLPPAAMASEPGSSSIFAAIQPYGLKLEAKKAPVELLIVDHVERTPTEN